MTSIIDFFYGLDYLYEGRVYAFLAVVRNRFLILPLLLSRRVETCIFLVAFLLAFVPPSPVFSLVSYPFSVGDGRVVAIMVCVEFFIFKVVREWDNGFVNFLCKTMQRTLFRLLVFFFRLFLIYIEIKRFSTKEEREKEEREGEENEASNGTPWNATFTTESDR